MLHTYEEALEWIHGRLRMGIKPGLKRMEWMMERLGNPERHLKTIHVGGTNGKGSTVTHLRSILQEAGYEVGTFTSPYIEIFNERISVNGQPVSDEEIVELANVIKPLAEEMDNTDFGGPTEFEIITAMAIVYFARIHPVDVAIFEVGLGGRFDSTNIIHPLVSIITNIGMDHMQFLGDSIEEIAMEKAGIIKSGVPVITAVKQPEAFQVIENKAKEKRTAVYSLGNQFTKEWLSSLPQGEKFHFQSVYGEYQELQTGLNGLHQTDNAALAVMGALNLKFLYSFLIDEEHIREGLKKAYWPGRLEVMLENPMIVIDGAHNPEGMNALAASLKTRYADYRVTAVFAGMKDKKLDDMIHTLSSCTDELIFTTFDYPRAAGLEDFEGFVQENRRIEGNWEGVIDTFKANAGEKELLVITGSLYFISTVKSVLEGK